VNLVDELHAIAAPWLVASSFTGFLEDRVEVTVPEGTLVVVSRDVLLRMKRLAGRPQDLADLEKLESTDGE